MTGSYLINSHIEIFRHVVDGMTAIDTAACRTVAAHGEKHAFGTGLTESRAIHGQETYRVQPRGMNPAREVESAAPFQKWSV